MSISMFIHDLELTIKKIRSFVSSDETNLRLYYKNGGALFGAGYPYKTDKVCPVILGYMDGLLEQPEENDTTAEREIVNALIPHVFNSKSSLEVSKNRAFRLLNIVMHNWAPDGLQNQGFVTEANKLARFHPIVGPLTAHQAQVLVRDLDDDHCIGSSCSTLFGTGQGIDNDRNGTQCYVLGGDAALVARLSRITKEEQIKVILNFLKFK